MVKDFILLYLYHLIVFQHHCRKCGMLVCGNCSEQKWLLPSQSSKPLRVCLTCFNELSMAKSASKPGMYDNELSMAKSALLLSSEMVKFASFYDCIKDSTL